MTSRIQDGYTVRTRGDTYLYRSTQSEQMYQRHPSQLTIFVQRWKWYNYKSFIQRVNSWKSMGSMYNIIVHKYHIASHTVTTNKSKFKRSKNPGLLTTFYMLFLLSPDPTHGSLHLIALLDIKFHANKWLESAKPTCPPTRIRPIINIDFRRLHWRFWFTLQHTSSFTAWMWAGSWLLNCTHW